MAKKMSNEKELKNKKYRTGKITDDEARIIEQTLPFSTYSEVARQLNRKPSTVRKFAQRNGITKDKVSQQKHTASEIKKDPMFLALENILSDDELVVAHSIYQNMCQEMGTDIKYSEKNEIIELGVVSCLLNRELRREKEIDDSIEEKTDLKNKLNAAKSSMDDEDIDDDFFEQLDDVDIALADLHTNQKDVKARQDRLMERKEKLRKSLHVTRASRAKDLAHATENFTNIIQYLKKNPDYRKEMGLMGEKMRLAMDAEWFRLSQAHQYADNEIDYPIYSSEVIDTHLEQQEKELQEKQEQLQKDREELEKIRNAQK